MTSCRCYIVPPHLLRAIANSEEVSESTRRAAQASLDSREKYTAKRKEIFEQLTRPRGYGSSQGFRSRARSIVPDTLLRHIAESEQVDEETRTRARRDLQHLSHVLQGVNVAQESEQVPLGGDKKTTPKERPYRAVYDAQNSFNENELPGKLVRAEGQPGVEDEAVNETYKNIGIVLDFYKEHFNWKSIDNENTDVISTVHFGSRYENACK